MPKSRKKKYKKKKNPARAPQAPKQTSAARVQAPKAPKAVKSGGQSADPNRQRQMWIALAIALGVFLLLILVARLTGGDNTTPETETVQSADEVTASGDATAQDSDSAVTASGDTTATTDSGDTNAATTASGDTTATANSGDTTATDNGNSEAASSTSGDMTATSNTAAATNDSSASTDNATANATPDSTAATNAATQDANAAVEYADIVVKDYGTITVELDPAAAPITVKNFVDLAQSGFYDNLTFHRIMDGFMIQGGDPNGNGTGGADETIVGEFASNNYTNSLSHTRGTISMARNSFDKDSASSQFFIVQKDSTFLDGDYAAFGHVTSGMDIVDKICADAEPVDDNGTIPADEQPIIESVTIREQ